MQDEVRLFPLCKGALSVCENKNLGDKKTHKQLVYVFGKLNGQKHVKKINTFNFFEI